MYKIILSFIISFFICSTAVFGCEVGPDYVRPTIARRVDKASHIIEGVAIELENRLNQEYGRAALVKVTRWLKGNGSQTVNIYNFGWGPDCKSSIPKSKAIFFTTKYDNSNYLLNYLGIFDAVISENESNIAEINSALKSNNNAK